MTFTNENPIRPEESKNEKVFSLKDVPQNVIERANVRLAELTRKESSSLERYGDHGKLIKMMSRASIYNIDFGPARA